MNVESAKKIARLSPLVDYVVIRELMEAARLLADTCESQERQLALSARLLAVARGEAEAKPVLVAETDDAVSRAMKPAFEEKP